MDDSTFLAIVPPFGDQRNPEQWNCYRFDYRLCQAVPKGAREQLDQINFVIVFPSGPRKNISKIAVFLLQG